MPITKPVRYPSGVSTDAPGTVNQDFPQIITNLQFQYINSTAIARSTDFTTTVTGSGTATNTTWPGGLLNITTSAASGDAVTMTSKTQGIQILPGNRSWVNASVATTTTANAQTFYLGMTDALTFGGATNAVYLFKPAGGSTLNLIVKNGATTTTFTNIADLAKPSGFYGDTTSYAGSLTFNATGTTFSTVAVTTAGNAGGAGYQRAPLIIPTGTGGSGAQVYCQIGSGALYAPYIAAAGSGYTAGTLGATILPFINLSMHYDGKGTLFIGVNGKCVISIGPYGATSVTAGATVANAANNSYTVTNQLGTGVAPVQPRTGAFENMAALVPMYPGIAVVNTSAAAATMYLNEMEFAGDLN